MNRDDFSCDDHPGLEEDADIVLVILRRVTALVPSLDPQLLVQVEAEIRATYGGMRLRIPKRGKHLRAGERQALFEDALTNAATSDLLRKHKISLATLKRVVKRGPF